MPFAIKQIKSPYVPTSDTGETPHMPDQLMQVIPDVGFHPEVRVYFDFLRSTTVNAYGQEMPRPNINQTIVDFSTAILSYLKGFVSKKTFSPFGSQIATLLQRNDIPALQEAINVAIHTLITSVSTHRSRALGGTASVTLQYQIRKTDPLFFNLVKNYMDLLLQPHMFVYIYGRGRLNSSLYYPMFYGLTNRVTYSNDAGFERIEIEIDDMSKLLRISQFMVSPALLDLTALPRYSHGRIALLGQQFVGWSISDILKALVVGTSGEEYKMDGIFNYQTLTDPQTIFDLEYIKPLTAEQLTADNLRRNNSLYLAMWGMDIVPYRKMGSPQIPIYSSEWKLRSEICNEVTRLTYTEIYADAIGNIQAHPIRLGKGFLVSTVVGPDSKMLQFVASPTDDPFCGVYVMGKEEITTSSFTLSDDGIVTALGFRGTAAPIAIEVVEGLLASFVVNDDLVARYGLRFEVNQEQLVNSAKDSNELSMYADAHMKLINADLYNSSVTSIFRPEMDVARPVYFPDRGDIFYIMNLSHSFSVGSTPLTTIGCSFGRKVSVKVIDFIEYLIQTNSFFTKDPAQDGQLYAKYVHELATSG